MRNHPREALIRSRSFRRFLLLLVIFGPSLIHAATAETSNPASPAACSDSARAIQWLRAIEQNDWTQMSRLLTPAATYYDPTMRYFDRAPVELEGAQAIVSFWRQSAEDSSAAGLRYTVRRCFESGGITVLELHLDIRVSGYYWNVDRETISLGGAQTTVVYEGSQGIERIVDYVDYRGVEEQVEQLRERFGSPPGADRPEASSRS